MAEYTREEVLDMVKAGKSLEGADLRGIDLSGAYILKPGLSIANLHEAELFGAELKGADLSGANLIGATLVHADLSETSLYKAKLNRADLSWSDLSLANLNEADIIGASLSMTNLSGSNLSKANLSNTSLYGANLYSANIKRANLSGVNLSNAKLYGANLNRANISAANLRDINLMGANLSGSNLMGSNLYGADLRGANLINTNMISADLGGSNLMGANLSGSNLSGSNLYRAKLCTAYLTEANMRDTSLVATDLELANLNYADISGANIYHIKTPGWKIENIKCTHIHCYKPLTADEEDREKNRKASRREFGKGEFEAIYKSIPTIELWFRDKFSFTDNLRLMDIQDRLQREVPDAHICLKKQEWVGKDMVVTLSVREEDKVKKAAEAVERLYNDTGLEREFLKPLKDAFNQKLLQSIPGIGKALAYGTEAEEKTGMTMFVNSPINITIQTGEGHTSVFADSVTETAIGLGASLKIIQNYEENKPAVDGLLTELRAGLVEDRKILIDQFTDALKTKDESKVKSIWGKVKDEIGTTSNMVSIVSGVGQLLGLYLSR